MSTWILIIMLSGGDGKAIDHVEFDTKDSCVQAIPKLITMGSWMQTPPKAICVENKHD